MVLPHTFALRIKYGNICKMICIPSYVWQRLSIDSSLANPEERHAVKVGIGPGWERAGGTGVDAAWLYSTLP